MAVEDRGPELLAIIWVFTSLAIIAVLLKFVSRAHILHALGWDDFFILLSVILIIICTSIFTYDVHLGMGKHAWDIPPDELSYVVKINFIGNPFGIMAYSFPNISVAILLERLMAPNKLRTVGLYTLVGLQVVIAAISCVLLFTQCTPSEHLWNPAVPAECFPAGTVSEYSYFVGSFTAFTEIVLGIVPIAGFWNLQLPTKTKVSLCFLMCCTIFSAICSIIKTTKLDQLSNLGDFTYGTVDLIIWAIVEANVIIIAACMPSLRPFFSSSSRKQQISESRPWFRLPSAFSTFNATSKKSIHSQQSGTRDQAGLRPSYQYDTEIGRLDEQ
ncbi:hypothetical protein F4809DRAFT_622384 [Biscogniauxia mediterranea]|nr:hypothetical protein F4809DRAFT_622384 [Biscogniauxia mediterranea]